MSYTILVNSKKSNNKKSHKMLSLPGNNYWLSIKRDL